jgi:CO/xanthine dehydrogenase Mo-binding subunit
LETLMDIAAYKIGMDPVQFRLKNINMYGNVESKIPFSNPGGVTCLNEAAKAIGWSQKFHAPKAKEVRPGVFHGIGLALANCSHGAGGTPATGSVIVNLDGMVQAVSASNEIGPGERTLMAMIAAEAIGVPIENISITTQVDTDLTSGTGSSGGSRQVNSGGWGMYEAGMDARNQILEWAAKKFVADKVATVTAKDLDLRKGEVFVKSDPTKKMKVGDAVTRSGASIIGRGMHQPIAGFERTAFFCQAAEIEVDTISGAVKVLKYVAAHDIGKALNPLALEQQIEGGVVMGLGAALTEELLVDQATGLPLNDNILDYRVPSMKDVPRTIDVILIEHARAYGVYGAHGIGEPPINPPTAVIANAVYNAIGVRLDRAPITREKILAAVKAA